MAKLLGETAESQALFETDKNGGVSPLQPKLAFSTFYKGFRHLSAKQVIRFLKLQLKDGSDQALVNTLFAIDEWGGSKNSSQQTLNVQLKANAAELLRLANLRPKPHPKTLTRFLDLVESLKDQKANSQMDSKAKLLFYKSKQLSEWLKVLETDLDPATQAEALRASAALYLSDGREDKLMALLQWYIQRNAKLFRGEEMKTCFLGFEDSLRKLPANQIAAFFKLQLKQGTEVSIDWVYQGMTGFTKQQTANVTSSVRVPFTKALRKELESEAPKLLRLIAARDSGDDIENLLDFVAGRLLPDPVSDEAIASIKEILNKLDANELSEALNIIPRRKLKSEFFAKLFAANIGRNGQYKLLYSSLLKEPVSSEASAWIIKIIPKLDAHELFQLLQITPNHIHISEILVAVKERLFAAETSDHDRSLLIYSLIPAKETTDVETTLILKILAEVVANQMDARENLDIETSNRFWRLSVKEQPSRRATVTRKLLNIICEQIVDPKTFLSLRNEIGDASSSRAIRNRSTASSSTRLSRTETLEKYKKYVNAYFSRYDVDDNGVLDGEEMRAVKRKTTFDTNKDGKVDFDEMLAAISPSSNGLSSAELPPMKLLSSHSRNRAAKLAEKVLAILTKPSSNGQDADPTELESFQNLQIYRDIETLSKIARKQSGEFSRFIDQDKRTFEGDPDVESAAEAKKQ